MLFNHDDNILTIRNYLVYTDDNIDNLKDLIKTDSVVKNSWDKQFQKAQELVEKSSHKAKDCQLLGLAYRTTGDEKYAKVIKNILIAYTSKEIWEGKELLSRTPARKGGLNTSHTSFFRDFYHSKRRNYRSLLADGRLKHRNSVINMSSW